MAQESVTNRTVRRRLRRESLSECVQGRAVEKLVFVDCQLGFKEGKMKGSTKPERMDEPFSLDPTTRVIEVVCSMSLAEMPEDVKALEERIVEKVQESGRQFYAAVFGAFQQRWLQQRRVDYMAVRWRRIALL